MEKAMNYQLHYSYIEILENELAVVSQLVTKKSHPDSQVTQWELRAQEQQDGRFGKW